MQNHSRCLNKHYKINFYKAHLNAVQVIGDQFSDAGASRYYFRLAKKRFDGWGLIKKFLNVAETGKICTAETWSLRNSDSLVFGMCGGHMSYLWNQKQTR